MTLILFDIDGTLIRTEGAGRRAFAYAAQQVFGRQDIMEGTSFAGSVDNQIIRELMHMAQIPPTGRHIARFRSHYARRLQRTLKPEHGTIMPGVEPLIHRLGEQCHLGLLTGNWVQGARIKLQNYQLWRHFDARASAFGGDGQVRDDLLQVAYQRAAKRRPPNHIIVIGDTPADVRCARAPLSDSSVRVTAVAVATGFASREALRAAKPDLMLEDLAAGADALMDLL